MNLSKSEKKIALELIGKSVEIECRAFMEAAKALLNAKDGGRTSKETFWELHNLCRDFGKQLRQTYDGFGGSEYAFRVAMLYRRGILTDEDIARFSPDVREYISRWRDA